MAKNFIQSEIRNAIDSQNLKFTLNAETRAMQVTGDDGIHDDTVETDIKGILEPLYAESILAKLGVRMYTGLPMGDIRVPAMSKGTCGWEGEVSDADASGNTFSSVLLQPKRISCYIDISKQLLAQDTIGVDAAIRRDLYNAIASKVQKTFLSADEGTSTKPAGIFYGETLKDITSYKDLCDFEAAVADANANGEKKYLVSNKAKAALRNMAKSALTNQLVLENGNIDGTQVIANSDVPSKNCIYGDFSNIVLASWGDIEVTVDPYSQAIKNCVRIVLNGFFDWKKVRASEDVLVYGKVDDEDEPIDPSTLDTSI